MARAEGCALVTGAARGIGAATAAALAADGWPVAINYRSDEASAKELAGRIESEGGRAITVAADVTDPEQVDAMFATAEAELGKVLVLVNNAGLRADGLAPQIKPDDWTRVLETNLTAAFLTTRRALRPMLRERFGRIVNIASVVGPRANAGQANYAASKAGLIGMTKTVAVEVARRGITVNAVAPGLVETQLTADLGPDLAQQIPARRLGTPQEIAACIGFLASEQAGYVTGSVLTVDGGLSA